MMTTCQREIRGFLAALQPSQAGLISIRSDRYFLNPKAPSVNSEVLVFNSLADADAVPGRDEMVKRAHSLSHQQRATDI